MTAWNNDNPTTAPINIIVRTGEDPVITAITITTITGTGITTAMIQDIGAIPEMIAGTIDPGGTDTGAWI